MWVNQIAKDYIIKGWVMDDERLIRRKHKEIRTGYQVDTVAGSSSVKLPCII